MKNNFYYLKNNNGFLTSNSGHTADVNQAEQFEASTLPNFDLDGLTLWRVPQDEVRREVSEEAEKKVTA